MAEKVKKCTNCSGKGWVSTSVGANTFVTTCPSCHGKKEVKST